MFRFEDKPKEGSFAIGDGYKGWITNGQKRLQVIISQDLLRVLSETGEPLEVLQSYSSALLTLAGEKWETGLAEEGDAGHYVLIVPKDKERIWALHQ